MDIPKDHKSENDTVKVLNSQINRIIERNQDEAFLKELLTMVVVWEKVFHNK